jgi:hypothetical protein
MRRPGTIIIALLLTAIVAAPLLNEVALAQTIGPGGVPMAPGPSQPRDFTPGGISPGGMVAPGPAARGVDIERTGPAGDRLAPGPAGSVSTDPTPRTPVVAPLPRDLRTTIGSKRRHMHRKGKRARPMARRF